MVLPDLQRHLFYNWTHLEKLGLIGIRIHQNLNTGNKCRLVLLLDSSQSNHTALNLFELSVEICHLLGCGWRGLLLHRKVVPFALVAIAGRCFEYSERFVAGD